MLSPIGYTHLKSVGPVFRICIRIFDITVSMGSQITGLVFMQFLLDGYQWYCFER